MSSFCWSPWSKVVVARSCNEPPMWCTYSMYIFVIQCEPSLYYRSPSSVFPFMTEENNKSVQSFPCENHAISIQQCDMLMGSIIDVWIRSSQTVVVFNTENTNVENAQQSDP